MTKRFDVVIGNPPYQQEASGDGTRDTPIYNLFMEAAYEVGTKAVLITPARFLFNAGLTPTAWNKKMLADPHLSVPQYVPNSNDLFPGTDIKGGIAVTYRDTGRVGEPIKTFTKFPELNDILFKVHDKHGESLESAGITTSRSYRYTDKLYEDHPDALALRPEGNTALVSTNAFEQFGFLYAEHKPDNSYDYIRVLGLIKNKRVHRWIRSEYISGPESFGAYKVVLSKANGTGKLGEKLSSPHVLPPKTAVTQSFITLGCFENAVPAEACLKYVKTKFARTLLGVLKITQDNPAKVWEHVPTQDFSPSSDIDWTMAVTEIDRQLYAKYDLTPQGHRLHRNPHHSDGVSAVTMISSSSPMTEIARRVRDARTTHGWSQNELAEQACVSRPTVARVEAGDDVNTAKLMRIAEALGLVLRIERQEVPGHE